MNDSETILQFGGGNFLRGFVDTFVHEANQKNQNVGKVVVVQSTRTGNADVINRQNGRYHVVTRGLRQGQPVDETQEVTSLSRAIDSNADWPGVVAVGTSPKLRYIVSNTTEAGFALDAADSSRPDGNVAPRSFPAKLLEVLWGRFDAKSRGALCILPCELLPKNGHKLRNLVLEQAQAWNTPSPVIDWMKNEISWINSLVDRIVSGRPASHPLLATDALLTVAEPFALWAVEADAHTPLFDHPAIQRVADTGPCELRKVRILNGCHTALVAKAMPMGILTVRACLENTEIRGWLRRLLDEEIIPVIEDRAPDVRAFADATLERFANPFLEHKLESIALNHDAKIKTRLIPTRDEFVQRFGRRPPLLDAILGS